MNIEKVYESLKRPFQVPKLELSTIYVGGYPKIWLSMVPPFSVPKSIGPSEVYGCCYHVYIYINNNHSGGSNYTPKNCTSGRILSSNSTYGKSPFSQVNFKCAIFHGNVSLLEGKHCPGSRPPEVAQSRSWRGERPEHRWGKT